jgi:hypothetical protein
VPAAQNAPGKAPLGRQDLIRDGREGLEMLGIPHDASARAVRLTGLDFLETVRECFSLWLCRNSFSDEKG